MKKIFIYLLLFSALWNTGCEGVLEVEPENSVTYTNYFKTVQDAEAILAGCERKIKMICCYGTLWSGTVGRCV